MKYFLRPFDNRNGEIVTTLDLTEHPPRIGESMLVDLPSRAGVEVRIVDIIHIAPRTTREHKVYLIYREKD